MPNAPILLPVVPMGQSIPRILHQHFLTGKAAIPYHIRKIRDALLAANPGWTDSFWDAARAEAFIEETYGAVVLARYRRIRPEYHAARSDLLRYLALYREGGVYLDVKSTCRVPLDEAIRPEDRYLLMTWGITGHHELAGIEGGEYVQWAIATVPGHPFLREVILSVLHNIDAYSEWRWGVGRRGTLRVTGPVAYTLAIAPCLALHPHTRLAHPDERGLVYTGLPNDESHRDLFGRKAHYTALDMPVVRQSVGTAVVSRCVSLLRQAPIAAAPLRRLRHALKSRSLT